MAPRVSVVVPVRNRRELLGQLLDALGRQSFRDFEVLVVDDGSTDGTVEEVHRRAELGEPLRLIRSDGRGAVAARQAGARAAAGCVLAFTDSDCIPDPDWLAMAMQALDGGADLVKGLTRPTRWPLEPFERSVASYEDGLYPTCNVFYRRDTFERCGGFEPHAGLLLGFGLARHARGLGFGEDALLAWRARRSGARAVYEPGAVVEHHVFPPDLRETLNRTLLVAAFPALLRELPELEGQLLRRGVFFGQRSRAALYLTAAGTLLRQRHLAVSGLAWWVACRALDLRKAPASRLRKLALLPAEMATDLLTAVALALGSARARRLVL